MIGRNVPEPDPFGPDSGALRLICLHGRRPPEKHLKSDSVLEQTDLVTC